MVGANQCRCVNEWASEPPNRTDLHDHLVGFGERLVVTRDRNLYA